MSNNHLIGKQLLEIRVAWKPAAHSLQQEVSTMYWQKVVPALERLFDRLVEPGVMIRLNKIEISLDVTSTQDMLSDDFVNRLLAAIESALAEEIKMPDKQAVVQPLHVDRFDLWLYFLEHGSLPVYAATPPSTPEWHRHIFDTLAMEVNAVEKLRRLVMTKPQALMRLILQYDADFLQQIITLFTGFRQGKLSESIQKIISLITHPETAPALSKQSETKIFKAETAVVVQGLLEVLIAVLPQLRQEMAKTEAIKKNLSEVLLDIFNQDKDVFKKFTDPETWQKTLASILTNKDRQTLLQSLSEWQTGDVSKVKAKAGKLNNHLPSGGKNAMKESLITAVWAELADCSSRPELRKLYRQTAKILSGLRVKLHRTSSEQPGIAPIFSTKSVRDLEIEAWSIILKDTVIQRRKAESIQLLAGMLQHAGMINWQSAVLKSLESQKAPNKDILRELAPILKKATANRTEKPAPEIAEQASGEQELLALMKQEDGFFIHCAGLVLLHPFLPTLFRKMDLLEKAAFKDDHSRQRAVCMLHFLATGSDQTPEYELTLPKFLCGMPLNMPIDHTITINEAEQAEGEQLLKAAIEHWEVLGNTSPDGLREGFLDRTGKLSYEQTGWLLRIERKTLDILLDRLPWGVGVIKLPWMEEMLKVNWNEKVH